MARHPTATSKANRPARTAAPAAPPSEPAPVIRPDVITDFSVQRGLLFVVLRNIGAASAWDVVTRFDGPLPRARRHEGHVHLGTLPVLPFMPPDKQFTQLVDPIAAYFQGDEPARLTATRTYRIARGIAIPRWCPTISRSIETSQRPYPAENPSPCSAKEPDMPTSSRRDPFHGFSFRVEIDGVAVAAFTECTGRSSETEVVEYRGEAIFGFGRCPA